MVFEDQRNDTSQKVRHKAAISDMERIIEDELGMKLRQAHQRTRILALGSQTLDELLRTCMLSLQELGYIRMVLEQVSLFQQVSALSSTECFHGPSNTFM